MTDESAGAHEARLTIDTWRRFVGALRSFLTSEVRGTAFALFGGLLALLFGISGLNVLNSYVGRDFMTAIERRDHAAFVWQAVLYTGVFGALTLTAVTFRFTEERFGLLWRQWLTRRLIAFYLRDRAYLHLSGTSGISNADQRIAEDTRTFVGMTLSLLLMLLNGTFTVIAFSGVLWSISRPLFLIGLGYAAAGSLLSLLLGRPLIRLNYRQADREADFRSELIHVRENAEAVALQHREEQLSARLFGRVDTLVANLKRIIAVNRNLGFFTTGYNYMIQIIPALIVAPLFMRGEAEFGVITQAAMAFSHLLGAFSLVVNQIQAISSYAAVLARLTALGDGLQSALTEEETTSIQMGTADDRLAYEVVTLHAPQDDRLLLRDLSASVPAGGRLLVRGDTASQTALFRATAGIWPRGEGRIVRPRLDDLAFLPERPYLPPGTLREAVTGHGQPSGGSDQRIREALRVLGVDEIVTRTGGLDVEQDWQAALSLQQQQLVSVASVLVAKPRFALLERIGTSLTPEQVAMALAALSEHGIGYVAFGDDEGGISRYDAILDLADEGRWSWRPT